ncbi:Aldehyde-alcohol dehydrogenase [Kluyvera cryocrescens]|uniref:Aldehyde-alcohol dehydrogenase n=1 Tax=Kluyvera cryocrescens TaxID=580 RepID=A0A485BQ91_KLUCR|nr:Aldehyde-alcohol dehydrogenase [Kluyvera cryocrescens]
MSTNCLKMRLMTSVPVQTPRYPLIAELKQILLDTFYGREYVEGAAEEKKEAAPAKAEKKAKK